MLTPVPQLLAHICAAMTLEPGDVVLTGTPAGIGVLRAGDTVQVRITGLPLLANPVT
jgi:2-keto-4-pentenoate hydratase/2-oxohepta-3-ene-1,7-dioic acid hydratase in catechol pathway